MGSITLERGWSLFVAIIPILLLLAIDFMTSFESGFYLDETENNKLGKANDKQINKYRIINSIVSLFIFAILSIVIKNSNNLNTILSLSQAGAIILISSIILQTDMKYHVINRHLIRILYIIPIILILLNVKSTYEILSLIFLLVVLFISFIFMTSIGASDFRCIIVSVLSINAWYNIYIALFSVIVSLLVSIIFFIVYRKTRKLTNEQMSKIGVPIGPILIAPGLIFSILEIAKNLLR